MVKKIALISLLSLFIISCTNKKYTPDVSNQTSDVKIIPFYKELHKTKAQDIPQKLAEISSKYRLFYRDFMLNVVGLHPNDSDVQLYVTKFLEFEANKLVFDACEKEFGDGEALKADLDKANRYYKHYFPKASLDTLFLQMSGFSTFMMVDTGFVAVSLERYLGSDCKFYNLLGDPIYLRKKMVREKLVPDVFKAIAMVEYPNRDSIDNLLSNMIHQGKILHFVAHVVPEISDTLLFDFSKEQLKWVEKNEQAAWSAMVEKKHLYSTELMVIQKYIGDGPFTSFFGQDSPSRVAVYIGYKIVEEYLRKYPNVTLNDLMNESNSQLILRKSGYNP